MSLHPEQRNAFEKGTSLKIARPDRKSIVMLDYLNAPEESRVFLEILDLPHFDETDAAANLSDTGHKLTNAWHAAWAHTHLGLSETLLCVIPILVVLPRDVDSAQVLTAFFTLHRRPGQAREEPHIRWLHRM